MTVTPEQIAAVMSEIGKIKTPKKAGASKRNGRKGGRPRQICPVCETVWTPDCPHCQWRAARRKYQQRKKKGL